MKIIKINSLIIIFIGIGVFLGLYILKSGNNFMEIESPQFENSSKMPEKYSCEGEGVSPELHFSDVPSEAKSLALIIFDPDVPKTLRQDGNWDHWLIWNMNPNLMEIKEGVAPNGVFGLTTSGGTSFVPACPPDREHRYFFKLYALDIMLDLGEGSTRQEFEEAMDKHIIESSELIGLYEKSNG